MTRPTINSKYTKELLLPIVASSCSMAEVFRKLGVKVTGGTYAWIPKVIAAHGLSTSHFTGQLTNSGAGHKGGPDKLSFTQILVYDRNQGRREDVRRLRRALVESGVPEKCSECGQGTVWNGQPLVLQVEHRNGNFVDNRPENVCFLCPNCHSQTATFSGRNANRGRAVTI